MVQFLLDNPIILGCVIVCLAPLVAGLVFAVMSPKLLLLVVKNLRRNLLRTGLTCLAIFVLVLMVTLILTVIFTLDQMTTEKSQDMKLIVTERWKVPSMLPLTHGYYLDPTKPQFILDKRDVGPNDFMTWTFYGGLTEQGKFSLDNLVFFLVMNPDHIRSMMEELEDLDPELVRKLKENPENCLLGRERMETINRQVGESFKLYGLNYKGLDLKFTIVGQLPEGRYNTAAIMNEDYFNKSMDDYAQKNKRKHPLDDQRIYMIWLRVRDREAFDRVAHTIETSSVFADRPVKCETASSATGTWFDAYRDLIWGIKVFLVPAILICMAMVVANAISISVRERRPEMAVLKVLGYRPRQILGLVLGESLFVGGASGLVAAVFTYFFFNLVYNGVPMPMRWMQGFRIPEISLTWGPAMGFAAAFLGSFFPAWSARSVKVSDVFAKVA